MATTIWMQSPKANRSKHQVRQMKHISSMCKLLAKQKFADWDVVTEASANMLSSQQWTVSTDRG